MKHHQLLIATIAVLCVFGCGGVDGPELGRVEGTVKLDGQPVSNAVLVFQPEHARPSYGRTNEEGRYELFYTDDKPGATIGTHTIKISTADGGDEDSEIAAQKETIPAKYNVLSELKRDVRSGSNVIDFDLESGGEIIEQNDASPAS